MSIDRVYRRGHPQPQGSAEDPLVLVRVQVRKHQLAELVLLADMEHSSRAALGREAIDRLVSYLKHLLSR